MKISEALWRPLLVIMVSNSALRSVSSSGGVNECVHPPHSAMPRHDEEEWATYYLWRWHEHLQTGSTSKIQNSTGILESKRTLFYAIKDNLRVWLIVTMSSIEPERSKISYGSGNTHTHYRRRWGAQWFERHPGRQLRVVESVSLHPTKRNISQK